MTIHFTCFKGQLNILYQEMKTEICFFFNVGSRIKNKKSISTDYNDGEIG